MRFRVFLYIFAFCVTIYSQDRICFIDSLDFCKDEIEKLERYNLKRFKRVYPAYRKYSNLKQVHFFWLNNKTNCPITKEEYMDYSFLEKLHFNRGRIITSWPRYKLSLYAITFLFTPEGKPVGIINGGFVEPPYSLGVYNAGELGRLMIENKISFAFNGGNREELYTSEIFNNGAGDMFCVVIDGKIFLLENFYFEDYPEDRNLRLTLLEDYIEQHTITDDKIDRFHK